jgi:hypothetical protein
MIYEVETCSGWIINRGRENGMEWKRKRKRSFRCGRSHPALRYARKKRTKRANS